VEHSGGPINWWVNNKYLGNDVEGFWALWELLSNEQRIGLNIQLLAAKYAQAWCVQRGQGDSGR